MARAETDVVVFSSAERSLWIHLRLRIVWLAVVAALLWCDSTGADEISRPRFAVEPPNRIAFSNSTGAAIPCTASGYPPPAITWLDHEGLPAADTRILNGLRHIREDGSLVFRPFTEREYSADVHHATYRCSATNVAGTIVSRDVKVRAVVLEEFEAHVHDDYVARDATALFRCHVPSNMRQYLSVDHWARDDGLLISYDDHIGGQRPRYHVTADGDLLVFDVSAKRDAGRRYRCHVRHRLTGDVRASVSAGSLFLTEPSNRTPPRIIKGQSTVDIVPGRDAILPCLARGHPTPTVRWYRRTGPRSGMVPISVSAAAASASSFVLPGLLILRSPHDIIQGRYVCLANNSLGEDRLDTELIFRQNVSVTVNPEDVRAELGRQLTFECSIRGISGEPIRGGIAFTWLHDGVAVPSTRLRGENQKLHIASVKREDAGVYQCLVLLRDVSAQGSAQLRIRDSHTKRSIQTRVNRRWNPVGSYLKPRKESQPDLKYVFGKMLVDVGERFSLRCVAAGSPLPRVTWALDGRAVSESHRVHYGDFVSAAGEVISYVNVTSVTRDDGGLYRCEATNDLGTAWHAERVDVRGPPRVRHMGNLTVTSGTTLVYHCPYTGHPSPKVTWSRGGRDLPHNERQRTFENGTLIVLDVNREADEGVYTCKASTGKLQAREDLRVKIIKKTVLNPFSFPKTLAEGMQVVITCSVRSGDPPIKIWWLKDGVPFSKTQLNIHESSLGDLGSNLVFNEVGRAHNGRYTCVAENDGGITNHTAELIVFVPPKWKIEPADKSSVVGSTVIFDCQADGHPQPLIRWKIALEDDPTKAFKSIISNYHMQMFENGSLIINDVGPGDAGKYLCEATNGIGAGISTVVRLSVHVSAHFKVSYHSLVVNKGDHARLSCEAFGERPISISWKKDNLVLDHRYISSFSQEDTPTSEGLSSSLVFAATDRADSGLYTCVTSNKYGRDETNIKLLVQETPDPPDDIRVIEAASRRILLRWNVPFNGNSEVLGYIIQWKPVTGSWQKDLRQMEISGTNTSALIDNLQPITAYHVRVLSVNQLGRSEPSSMISITTDEEVPSSPPADVAVVPISSQSMKVSWKSPPNFSSHGRIRGYYVGYKQVGTGDAFVYKTIDVQEGFVAEITINNLKRSTKYSVIVQAFNGKGAGPASTEVSAQTYDHDPPLPPVLRVLTTTATAITINWEFIQKDDTPITGLILFWKAENGDWSERAVSGGSSIAGATDTHTLEALNCGTRYHLYAVAFNQVGRSEPSASVSATTAGGAPVAPDKNELLISNSTAVSLNLRSWKDGGCAIRYFAVQYKLRGQRDWTALPETIEASNADVYTLTKLQPSSWYHLLMSSNNDAGSTEAQFMFATLTPSGATIPPMTLHPEESTGSFPKSVTLVIPVVCAFIVLLVIGVVVYMVCSRKGRSHDYGTTAHASDRACSVDLKGDSISMASVGKKIYEAPRRDPIYFPSPYATTHISVYSAESESPSGGPRVQPQQHVGGNGATTGRPDHTYDVPFPPKQYPSQPSREFNEESHYTSIFRTNPATTGEGQWDELLVERAAYGGDSGSTGEVRYDRLPRQRFSLTKVEQKGEGLSDEDSNPDEIDSRGFEGNTASENLEMSEAECDRDFQIYAKKGRNLSLAQYAKTRPVHTASYVTYH
ncbi:cell adhesion molecule Dscam1-like [Ornithodoros turicata]|uniref:cell adhesion molecule Dscam1-like n=1 Tax=Ornithodoros turicata TaxID=34597 RepID=UPI003139E2BE